MEASGVPSAGGTTLAPQAGQNWAAGSIAWPQVVQNTIYLRSALKKHLRTAGTSSSRRSVPLGTSAHPDRPGIACDRCGIQQAPDPDVGLERTFPLLA